MPTPDSSRARTVDTPVILDAFRCLPLGWALELIGALDDSSRSLPSSCAF
jgi:hypothetical protein